MFTLNYPTQLSILVFTSTVTFPPLSTALQIGPAPLHCSTLPTHAHSKPYKETTRMKHIDKNVLFKCHVGLIPYNPPIYHELALQERDTPY